MNILKTLFRFSAMLLGAGLTLHASSSFAARCEYLVQSDWSTGFVASIRITNDSTAPINNWSVNWAYTDGSRRIGGWNATVSGNNPYSASGVGWNNQINPGQKVEFGVQGSKVSGAPAQRPTVTGAVCSSVSSVTSSTSVSRSSSSKPSSLSSSSRTSSSSSFTTSSSSSKSRSSSSVSSRPNTAPVLDMQTTATGLTLQVDGRDTFDADNQRLQYTIDFGDGTVISYPQAWHTYKEPGDYEVTLRVSDGFANVSETRVISIQAVNGNRAPIARLTTTFSNRTFVAHGTSSYDEEGIPLTYEWDFGEGAYPGDSRSSFTVCGSSSSSSSAPGSNYLSRLVTLTVSDGELKDTIQRSTSGQCGFYYDLLPKAEYSYRVEGNQLTVDASESRDETGFSWDFGDGTTATGLKASHTYAAPGTYNVRLHLSGPTLFSNSITKVIVIGSGGSSSHAVSSSSSLPYSSVASSSVPASSSSPNTSMSSSGNSSSATSTVPNTRPVAVLNVVTHGMTVFIDGSQSTDAEGPLNYKIYTGDPNRPTIFYPTVWNTYATPGEYSIALEVWDSVGASHVVSKKITVQPAAGNQAPIAMLTAVREYNARIGHATASFDPEGTPLTYEWDFGKGVFAGDARASVSDCSSSQASVYTGYVTVTVSDGELKDTRQTYVSGLCGTVMDVLPQPAFSYRLEGNKIFVDGRKSRDVTRLSWDFGDGSPRVSGLLAEHTYAATGTYTVELTVEGPSLFSNRTSQTVVLGSASSASSSGVLSSSATASSAAGL